MKVKLVVSIAVLNVLILASPLFGASKREPGSGWVTAQFNPKLGARATGWVELERRAIATVRVRSSDGSVVRTLAGHREFEAGRSTLIWDGRSDLGAIVSNGAYVIECALHGDERSSAKALLEPGWQRQEVQSYDRRDGLIAFDLPSASVVRILGFGKGGGRVWSKVVVESQARVEGSNVEPWDGFDETGSVYLPALSEFTIFVEYRRFTVDAVVVYGGAPGDSASSGMEVSR